MCKNPHAFPFLFIVIFDCYRILFRAEIECKPRILASIMKLTQNLASKSTLFTIIKWKEASRERIDSFCPKAHRIHHRRYPANSSTTMISLLSFYLFLCLLSQENKFHRLKCLPFFSFIVDCWESCKHRNLSDFFTHYRQLFFFLSMKERFIICGIKFEGSDYDAIKRDTSCLQINTQDTRIDSLKQSQPNSVIKGNTCLLIPMSDWFLFSLFSILLNHLHFNPIFCWSNTSSFIFVWKFRD
jgi:hypothetical protein